jgi:outer membrane immunogenic protein
MKSDGSSLIKEWRKVMRKIFLTSASVLAMSMVAAAAMAADIPRKAPAAPAPVYAPYNWTGAYVGINGGYGWGNSDFAAPFSSSYRTSGGLVGGTLGYNWQMGQTVFGIEGDLDWSGIRGSAACAGTSCETKNNWLSTVRGRIGYAADRFMPYFTGGLAVGNINTSVVSIGSSSTTKAGWTIGGGLEAAVAPRLTAKIEYLYVDLGRGGSVLGADSKFNANVVRAGLNYRF